MPYHLPLQIVLYEVTTIYAIDIRYDSYQVFTEAR